MEGDHATALNAAEAVAQVASVRYSTSIAAGRYCSPETARAFRTR